MCGIAGFLSEPGNVFSPGLLESMCDRLSHRGPDDYGSWIHDAGRAGQVALGHRRLSIIDLAGGHQPLGNEDGSIQIVFNGEIYNYQDLRSDLIRRGHQFATNSDTEVLVHLYEDAGERTPEYLNGMFSFVIWDGRNRCLFAARDRLGKKPLYYTFDAPRMRFAFASELKAFADLPDFRPDVDERSVADFLSLSYVPDPASIYRQIRKLPPGHTLTLTQDDSKLRKYWQPEFRTNPRLRFDDAVEQLQSLAIDSVRRRMVSDVPLGAFLSGGIDSTAVVGMMAQQAPEYVRTFSIGFDVEEFNELEFARIAASFHKTQHSEETVTPAIPDAFSSLVRHFDEPFGDTSAIPSLYLARMTRQHVTVALSGDGADELFAGYRRYRFAVMEERVRRMFPELFRTSLFRIAGEYYPKLDWAPRVFRAKTTLANIAQGLGDAYFTSMSAFRDGGLRSILSPELSAGLDGYDPRHAFAGRFHNHRHYTPLEQLQAVDFETYLPGDILVKADRATMAHSIESRSPWLDYRIAELAASLPSSYKLAGGVGKLILKRAMASYIPKQLLTRPKMGFTPPVASWLRGSLRHAFEKVVLRTEMERYINPAEVRRLWTEHQSGRHNHEKKLWNLLVLGAWDAARWTSSETEVLAEAAESMR